MTRPILFLKRLLDDEEGASLLECSILVSLVAAGCMVFACRLVPLLSVDSPASEFLYRWFIG